MTRAGKFLTATAATFMAVAPGHAAIANPAAALSVAKSARASTPVGKPSKLGGQNGGVLVALSVGVAIAIAVIIATSDGSDSPSSP